MKQKIFWRIALACFLASFISAMMLQRIGLRYFFQLIPQSVITIITLVYFIAMLFYIVIGINAKVHKEGDTTSLLAFWQDAIRYFIALDMFVFGLCKFFHIQFNTPMALLDNPFNTIANDDLMWAFYGRSYAFTLLIGTMEMVGALLLLFKRTWLVAIFFLLPICLNIFCLDIFYNGIGTAVYIAIEIMGLIYLLFIEYDRLIQFFFVDKSNAAEFNFKKSGLKNMIKLSVVIIPAILMILVKKGQYYPEIDGKYLVKSLSINHALQKLPTDDSILTKVYIDKHDLVLEYNSYKRRIIGSYEYDKATSRLITIWRYPQNFHDTLFAHISPGSKNGMKILIGRMGTDSLNIQIQKTNLPTR